MEERRGHGRDDYPIRPMWNALLAVIVFQHRCAASLIRELWRNGELRSLCGFDPSLGTGAAPKYRCPAAHYDSVCPGRKECERLSKVGVGKFGRTIRVPLEFDRRIFTPVARHTCKWEKAYDRRTSVERVNSRIDRVLGLVCLLAPFETPCELILLAGLLMDAEKPLPAIPSPVFASSIH